MFVTELYDLSSLDSKTAFIFEDTSLLDRLTPESSGSTAGVTGSFGRIEAPIQDKKRGSLLNFKYGLVQT